MTLHLPTSDDCSFCDDIAGVRECVFVVDDDEHAVVEMNLRQYELGAMLVVPRDHCESILEISPGNLAAVHRLAQRVARAAITALGANGVSIFQNNGLSSGQSEPHFHVHVVPRYSTSDPSRNFRSTDFAVISISQQEEVARKIRRAL